MHDDVDWWIETEPSKQRFRIAPDAKLPLGETPSGKSEEITGDWQTAGKGEAPREVIVPHSAKAVSSQLNPDRKREFAVRNIEASIGGAGSVASPTLAAIQTSSAYLGIYKGVVVAQRYYFNHLHLGDLKVDHHTILIGLAYTPWPRLQLGAELPYHLFSQSGTSGHNGCNSELWAKFRFYNSPETGGERRASVRLGVEAPSMGKSVFKTSVLPSNQPGISEFVRRQVLHVNGGPAAHIDTSYSGAMRRWIYVANIGGIVRSKFDGFRMGHEVRVNGELQYVILPLEYNSPRQELRLVIEQIIRT